TLALSAVLTSGTQSTTAGQLITKMLGYYHDANTLTGTIVLTATDGAGTANLNTRVQFEKPSKLFIEQTLGGRNPQSWYVTSDGVNFTYSSPDNLMGSQPGGK